MLSLVIVPNRSAWNSRVLQAYLKPHSATKKGFHDGLSTSLVSLEKASLRIKSSKDVMTGPPQNIHQEVWFDVFRFSEFQCMAMFMFLAISQGRCLGMASSYIYQLRVLQEFDNFECETIVIIQFGVFAMTWTWNIMEFEQWYINAFWRICPHLKFKQLIVLIFVFFFTKFLHHIACSYTWSVATISSTVMQLRHGRRQWHDTMATPGARIWFVDQKTQSGGGCPLFRTKNVYIYILPHSIHGNGICTCMNGWYLWYMYNKTYI